MATNYNLMEVTCQRSNTLSAFSQGVQDYVFTIGSPNCINFARSYFRVDLSIQPSDANNNPVFNTGMPAGALITLADNAVGNLFTNGFVRFGGQDVSSITSFLPQASALKKRIHKSQSWLETIGRGAQQDIASFASRVYQSSYSVYKDRGNGDNQYLLKGCVDANQGTANLSVIANAGGLSTLTFIGTLLNTASTVAGDTEVFVGDILVVQGSKYTITTVTDDTHIVVQPQLTANAGPAAITDYYFIRQNTQNTSVSKNNVSILWQPPLGIFDINTFFGAGDYRISLVPNANYKIDCVETRNPLYNVANGFTLAVNACRFYAYQAKQNIPEGPSVFEMMESLVLSKPITSSNGQGNYQFSVPPSTMYITVFVQSNSAGSDSKYPSSMFKAPNTTGFGGPQGDLTLTNLQLTYASINKPSTNWQSNWSALPQASIGTSSQLDQMVQRYYDSYLEMNNTANSDTACESLDDWLQRGPFYHFVFARDMTDRATEVQLNATFTNISTGSAGIPGSNIFVVAWYHNVVNYTVSQGLITNVSTRQV